MTAGGDPGAAGLTETLPIFPLTGALLLPGGELPLNVFEPRYLQMVGEAMAGGRLIGMVQPTESERAVARPRLYRIGCAGRITAFSETDDGRNLITLTGVCRFRIVEEVAVDTLYRRARVSYQPYCADLGQAEECAADRDRLILSLRAYAEAEDTEFDWSAIDGFETDALVNTLAMAGPFEPNEKQALLEAVSLSERTRALIALIDMAALQTQDSDGAPPQ